MSARLPDWWERLQTTVRNYEGAPWVWGETDCAMFAAACVFAVRGVDPSKTWRGIYDTRLGSVSRLMHRGHRTLAAAAHAELTKLGAIEIDPHAAQCGDIGVTIDDILAVRLPRGFIARRETGDYGVARYIQKAWAI